MEKLSHILPPSPRTKKVDLSRSQPVRPGAPSFGRPEGVATERLKWSDMVGTQNPEDRISIGAHPNNPTNTYGKSKEISPKEAEKMEIVADLNQKFFEKPLEDDLTEEETQEVI